MCTIVNYLSSYWNDHSICGPKGQAPHLSPRRVKPFFWPSYACHAPKQLGRRDFNFGSWKKKQFHSCFEKNTMRHITRSCFQSKPARDHRHSPIFHWIALSHPPTPGLSSPLQAIKNARAGLNVRYQMCDFTQIFYIARSVLAILSLNIESPNNGIPLVI